MNGEARERPDNSYIQEAEEAIARIYHHARAGYLDWDGTSTAQNGRPESPRQLHEAFPALYHGGSGISLFLAAHYAITRHPEARQLALQSLVPLRKQVAQLLETPSPFPVHYPLGGLKGIASSIFTLSQLAAWLNEPVLLTIARDVTNILSPEHLASDTHLDIVSGCAGTLLCLLSFLQEASRMGVESGPALDLALAGGQRLLDQRVSFRSLPRAWATEANPPLSGFAYGAAGIGYALVRLFEWTKQEKFLDAAIEGFAFERSLYLPEFGAWLDLRSDRPGSGNSWYEGAPGIALSRLGSISVVDLASLRHDLEEALRITRVLPLLSQDHLNWGNFGLIDIMHTAGEKLGRMQLTAHAHHLANEVLRQRKNSGFIFADEPTPAPNQSLFLGLSGVGYVLLRILYPGELPSILLLEVPA
jgi:lantibiotic modifying enzyme